MRSHDSDVLTRPAICQVRLQSHTQGGAHFIRRLTAVMARYSERGGHAYVRWHASSALVEYANAHNPILEYTVYGDRINATHGNHRRDESDCSVRCVSLDLLALGLQPSGAV